MSTMLSPREPSCLLTLVESVQQRAVALLANPEVAEEGALLSQAQALNLETCARVCQLDVASTLELLGDLIGDYSEDAGAEVQLFAGCGSALRLLGGVLVLANQVGEYAADALRLHPHH